MNGRKTRVISIGIGLCLILSVIAVGALEYWANEYGTKGVLNLTLYNNSHFLPSHKTNSTAYGVQQGKYIKSAWTTIKEGDTNYKKSTSNYPKTYTSDVYCTNERGNNPLYGQSFTHGWAYN